MEVEKIRCFRSERLCLDKIGFHFASFAKPAQYQSCCTLLSQQPQHYSPLEQDVNHPMIQKRDDKKVTEKKEIHQK